MQNMCSVDLKDHIPAACFMFCCWEALVGRFLNFRNYFGALSSFSHGLQEDGGKRVLGYWLAFGALVTGGAAAFELVIRQADVLPPGEGTFIARSFFSPFVPARLAFALVPFVPRVTCKNCLEDDLWTTWLFLYLHVFSSWKLQVTRTTCHQSVPMAAHLRRCPCS
jgi:hypothetical protein